jgi:hypothetical protein
MGRSNAGRTRLGLEHPVTDDSWNGVRRERLVKNEMAFRDYNNRRVEMEQRAVAVNQEEVAPFVCECGNADCIGALMVTVDEYETAHSTPDRFIVKPEHVYPDVEHVLEHHDHYWVVEKHPGEMPLH